MKCVICLASFPEAPTNMCFDCKAIKISPERILKQIYGVNICPVFAWNR